MNIKFLLILLLLLLNQLQDCICCCHHESQLNENIIQCAPKYNSRNSLTVRKSSYNMTCEKKIILESEDLKNQRTVTAYGVSYGKDEFCTDIDIEDRIIVCPCIKRKCLNMCCPYGTIYNASSAECVKYTDENLDWNIRNITNDNQFNPIYLNKQFKCKSNETELFLNLDDNLKLNHFIITDNYIRIYFKNGSMDFNKSEFDFCVSPVIISDNQIENFIRGCVHSEVADNNSNHNYKTVLYAVFLIIGSLFLLLTLIIYVILPEKRKGVRGLSLMSHCACMLIGHIGLIVIHLADLNTLGLCKTFAFLTQYFTLTAFFWLNAFCLDIALTFRSFSSMVGNDYYKELKHFKRYAMVSMSIPLIIVIITIAVNEGVDYNSYKNIHPGIVDELEDGRCFLNNSFYSTLLFFFGPIGLLLLLNILLFIYTTFKICITRDRSLSSLDSYRHGQKDIRDNVLLYIKLSLLMGIPWITEIISWGIGDKSFFWIITDGFNILRSILIFILFCCNKEVYNLLKRKIFVANPGAGQLQFHVKKSDSSSNYTQSTKSGD